MSDDHADGSIVERFVGSWVEEGALEDAGGEADFVGRGIVIGVDGLWCHEPLVAVDGASGSFFDVSVVCEFAAGHHVFVVRFCRIDGQSAVVDPLVGITDFDVELIEFLMCSGFCGIAHPGLCVDALA